MAKVIRKNNISSALNDDEKAILDKVDAIIPDSKAEFIRKAVMKEANKILKKA